MSDTLGKPKDNTLFIAGVGASAGGLKALTKLVASLPTDTDCLAFVVAQHVSPDHKSKLVELLNRDAQWPVVAAEDQMKIQPTRIYVTPPDVEIRIERGAIVLEKQHRTVHAVPSIDGLFTSLAEDQRAQAIGIILSGTGRDGAQGMADIRARGGYTFVQPPEEAQHRGMPDAAIELGHAHTVVSVHQMGDALVQYTENGGRYEDIEVHETSLSGIFRLLTDQTGTDFSRYKASTIGRRINKRLGALSIHSVDEYYEYVQEHPEELDQLFQTVLIGVTEFFRDSAAFEALRTYVNQLLEHKQPGDAIRAWSVGCATGEEAYSIAILIAEALGETRDQHTVQIFATDIDESALATGRRGAYSDKLVENLSQSQLENYFNRSQDGYEIKKSIRQWVLFSRHDITKDPPFVRLDLITCRNLLIYFNHELQRKVVPAFHYALREEGYLLLGKSENIIQLTDLFVKEDIKQKLFRKKSDVSLNTLTYTSFKSSSTHVRSSERSPGKPELSLEALADQTLLQTYEYPLVVVNDTMEVVHIRGKLQAYVDLDEGTLNASILKIVNKELHMELRTTFTRARQEAQPSKSNIIRFTSYDQSQLVRLSIKPCSYRKNDRDYYLIIFEHIDSLDQYPFSPEELDLDRDEHRNAVRVMELEHELAATREHLQTFTEELETSNEELQALNEELQSANEELNLSNEELETSNEELQSANEELETANSELAISNENLIEKEREVMQARNELEVSRDRFRLGLENAPIVLFYQDTQLRYTWQHNNHPDFKVEDVLGKTDDELLGTDHQDLIALKRKVLHTGESVRTEVAVNNLHYDIFIKSIRDGQHIAGIKGVAIDITERVQAQRQIEKQQAIIRSIVDESDENVLAVDQDYRVLIANPAQQNEFDRLFGKGIKPGDNILQLLQEHPDAQANTHQLFSRALRGENVQLERYQTSRVNEFGNARHYDIDIIPIRRADGTVMGGALLSRETTQRVLVERKIETIIERSANLTGEEFFKNLTQQTYELFRIKYVYIGLLDAPKENIHTKALRVSGKLSPNISYALQGVPCQTVAGNEEARYIQHVGQQFPEDPKLQRWNAESYVGIPVASPLSGETLAILVMIDDKPLEESPNLGYAMNVLILRAGAELERMRTEEQLRKQQQQLDNVTRNVADVLFESVTPAEGDPYFRFVSRAVNDIYELTVDEMMRDMSKAFEIIHPDDIDRFLLLRDQIMQQDSGNVSFTGRIIAARSQRTKWVTISAKTERQENNDIVWYGTITDVTEIKQTQTELQWAKEQAEAAARAKEDFLATMSHEIRTPLNAIVGLSNLLLNQAPAEQQLENLQTLKFSSENLMSLINDILDFSKIEAGKVKINPAPFNLSQFLNNLRHAHQPRAEENHNELTVRRDPDVPETVVGDQVKLGQVLNNLLSNAIKFTEGGQVTLTVSTEPDDRVCFSVRDTGIGITSDKLDNIFEKFTQADSSTVRHYGGTGLGLTITKTLLEFMESKIRVESTPGEGSRFSFSLPLPASESAVPTDTAATSAPLAEIRGSILVVEDIAVNRMILRQYLQELPEIKIDEAVNGEEALRKATDHHYDLIMMDVRMPIMDGYQATQAIRALPDRNKEVPIIALTADTSDMISERGTNYFTDVLTKPYAPEELFRKIRQHLAPTAPPASSNQLSDNDDGQATDIDFTEAEDQFSTREQRQRFYEVVGASLVEYRDEYQQAIARKDASALENIAHKFKTTLSIFGQLTLYERMQQEAAWLAQGNDDTAQSSGQWSLRQLDNLVSRITERQKYIGQ